MKEIVNIVSTESPVPAYLFTLEKYVPGDRLMFIGANDSRNAMNQLIKVLDVPADKIDEVILNEGDEFLYERICRRLRDELRDDVSYWVNLTGGTRYLALAVEQAFSKKHTAFFYTNMRDNTIIKTIFDDSIDDDDDYVYPIMHKMKVGEYLTLHGILHDVEKTSAHLPIREEAYVRHLFNLFADNRINNADHEILDVLRVDYRNYIQKRSLRIADMEQGRVPRCAAIPHLSRFLKFIAFVPEQAGHLNKAEICFLTGGWFEEHCYYLARRYFRPDDILIGVHVARAGVNHHNELDVIFIKDNQLHVIESKSGISGNKLFNEIVYKACAIKDALLGLMCRYYLFSLKKDNAQEDFRKIAATMGVEFWGDTKLKEIAELY